MVFTSNATSEICEPFVDKQYFNNSETIIMKRFIFSNLLVILLCFVSSCEKEKDEIEKMEGTWDYDTKEYRYFANPENNYSKKVEGYMVIKDGTIAFYSKNEIGAGTPMSFEYRDPHIFIAGHNTYDLVSLSNDRMSWRSTSSKEGEEKIHTYNKRK